MIRAAWLDRLGPGGRAIGRATHRRGLAEPSIVGFAYALPVLVVFGLFVFVPFAHMVVLSFQRWNGVTPARWIGLDNYLGLLDDERMVAAFSHAAVLVVFYSVIPILLALLLTVVLSRSRIRGMTIFRATLFLPQVVSLVVVGASWTWLLAPTGPINSTLEAVGLGNFARPWLGDFDTALITIGFIASWLMFGLPLVLFLAGVQKIHPELYDAARIDGAGAFAEFRAVTLPGLRNELVVAVVLTTTTSLRAFDLIYVLTKGGPGTTTTVPAFEIYQAAFVRGQLGAAAASGVVLAAIILTIAIVLVRIGRVRS